MTFDFYAYLSDVRLAKAAADLPSQPDAYRNDGRRRTPAKRAALAGMASRARAAGRTPVAANY